MRDAWRGAAAAMVVALALAQARAEDVRLLAGFEWEEWSAHLGRFQYLGKPNLTPPGPGWKGERIAGVEAVDIRTVRVRTGEKG